jgi:hypothetical protein
MSQVTQPRFQISRYEPSNVMLVLASALALAGTIAVVLLFVLDDSSDTSSGSGVSGPALRSDGGPDEGTIAFSVGSRAPAGPNEAAIASSVRSGTPTVIVAAPRSGGEFVLRHHPR